MFEQVKVRETPLKNLFSLFQAQLLIELAELGDTWHPSDGFVNETILNNPETVQDIIDFNYDLGGLVIFEAEIENIKISLPFGKEYFVIEGSQIDIYFFVKRVQKRNYSNLIIVN